MSEQGGWDRDVAAGRLPWSVNDPASRLTDLETATELEDVNRAEIRLREPATYGVQHQIEETISRLQQLEKRGILQAVDVDFWGRGVTVGRRAAVDRYRIYRAFKEWADTHDCDLTPAFQRRVTNQTLLDDEPRIVRIVVPIICLALYGADGIEAVFPHCVDGEAVTVERALELLEAGISPETLLEDQR